MELAKINIEVEKVFFMEKAGLFKRNRVPWIHVKSLYETSPGIKSVAINELSTLTTLDRTLRAEIKRLKSSEKIKSDVTLPPCPSYDSRSKLSKDVLRYHVEGYLEAIEAIASLDVRLILIEWLKLDEYKPPAFTKENVILNEQSDYSIPASSSEVFFETKEVCLSSTVI